MEVLRQRPWLAFVLVVLVSGGVVPVLAQVIPTGASGMGSSVLSAGGGSGGAPSGPAGGDLSGTYPNPTIASGAVTSTHILNGTIAAADIANDTITATQIAAGACATSEILDGTILTGDISTGGVTTTNILDGTILTGDISTGGVTSTNILDGTIAAGDIANDTITATQIATGACATAEILDGTVSTTDLNTTSVDARYCTLAGCTMTGGVTSSAVATDVTTGTNEDYTITPNGTGVVVLGKGLTISGVTNDITTGTNEALTLVPNGTGAITLQSGSSVINFNDSAGGTDITWTGDTGGTRGQFQVSGGGASLGFYGTSMMSGFTTNRAATSHAWCAGDGMTTSSGTALLCVDGEGMMNFPSPLAQTCTDSGNGSPATKTIDPTSSVVNITNSDADGCTVTLSETSAVAGGIVRFVVVSNAGGVVTFANTANVHAGPTCATTTGLGLADAYSVAYAGTLNEYVGISCSDN